MLAFILKGGWVLIPIFIASVISVAVSIERFLYWQKEKRQEEAFLDQFFQRMEAKDPSGARNLLKKASTGISRILARGLDHPTSASKAMEESALKEIQKTKKNLSALDTIITLAPLLGLLGTILGMISAFNVMAVSGTQNPMAVTGGVAEALIATAAGLVVAIITLIPYNYFLARTEEFTENAEQYATRLELILERSQELGVRSQERVS